MGKQTDERLTKHDAAKPGRAPVTVIGLGAMGQALAGALLNAGHPVTIWNRSPGKGGGLVARGAKLAASAAEAVAASPLVVVCVLTYEASREILASAGGALSGRTLVELTSDTPERAREAAIWAAARGVDYLDGSVMVPTAVVGRPEALFLYSGSRAAFERHRPALDALGGNAKYLGEDPGLAALYDLGLLNIFYSSMASLVHALALVGADGVRASAFLPFANEFFALLPGMAAPVARAVDEGKHPGEFDNLRMEAVGIEHIVEASRARGLDVGLPSALKAVFDRAIAAGHGGDSLSSLVEVLRKPPA